jgi:hypothetical protein
MVNANAVKKGDIMALVYWVQVDNAYPNSMSVHHIDNKEPFNVNGNSLIEKCYSADVFESTTKITKTQMAEKLTVSWNKPFTVVFTKQDGEKRVLRGKLVAPEPLLGRSQVHDLDVTDGSPLRLVDHRTLEFLIVDNVRYTLKK